MFRRAAICKLKVSTWKVRSPSWRYALEDALLEKRVWMKQGENTTYIRYSLVRGGPVVDVDAKALVNYRDFHLTTRTPNWQTRTEPVEHGLRAVAFEGATPFYLRSAAGTWGARAEWYKDYFLPMELKRGLDDDEDRLFAGQFHRQLHTGEGVTIV